MIVVERTRSKFDEAQFFLERMKESRGTEEFQYYLSAFLSAARAVTWVLDKEYKNSEYADDFVNWYGVHLKTMRYLKKEL